MNIYVTGYGVSTQNFLNVNDLCDCLIEKKDKKHPYNNSSLEYAVSQTSFNSGNIIIIGNKIEDIKFNNKTLFADNLTEALKIAANHEESLILYIEGSTDFVAISISNQICPQAKIEVSTITDEFNQSVYFFENGEPIEELLNFICGCVSLENFYSVPIGDSPFILDYTCINNRELCIKANNHWQIVLKQLPQLSVEYKKSCFSDYFLLPISFVDIEEGIKKLEDLKAKSNNFSFDIVAKNTLSEFTFGKYRTVVFCAHNTESLINQVDSFLSVINQWLQNNFNWKTPEGSFYTSNPVGRDAKICFMNPPGGSFIRLPFYRLLRNMPYLHNSIKDIMVQIDTNDDLINRYAFEIVSTKVILDALKSIGLNPDYALGGSLGEISLSLSSGFIESMTIEKSNNVAIANAVNLIVNAVRDILKHQSHYIKSFFGEDIEIERWYLKFDKSKIETAIENNNLKRTVFISIIGSDVDVIITGKKSDCAYLIEYLHCYATKLQDTLLVHTPAFEKARPSIQKNLKHIGVHISDNQSFKIYSTTKHIPLDSSVEMFSSNFADCLICQVDMISVMKKAYEDSNRVFIDIGTNGLCNQWAKKTFEDCSDAVLLTPFTDNNIGDSFLTFIAQIISNNLPIDLSAVCNIYGWNKTNKTSYHTSANVINNLINIKDVALDTKETMQQKDLKIIDFTNTYSESNTNSELNEYIIKQINNNRVLFSNFISQQKSILSILASQNYSKNEKFDYDDILEMTNGSMAKVLGSKYNDVDKYSVRARMPSPPFLFASRILNINAEYYKLLPGSSIEAEYDVSNDCILKTSNTIVSPLVFGESSHIGIFLAGYMGIDVISNGTVKFRVTDTNTTYYSHRYPKVGETSRIIFTIDKFINNGDTTLIICNFKIFLGENLCISSKEIGGFFTNEVLRKGVGFKKRFEEKLLPTQFEMYKPISNKVVFTEQEVKSFLKGNIEDCFGTSLPSGKSQYFVEDRIMLVDRIIDISLSGGLHGLGYIIGEKDIDETFWAFNCHFKNDPVLPGTIMLEGVTQVSLFFQIYTGLYNNGSNLSACAAPDHTVKTLFRGEVKPSKHMLRYRIDPSDISVSKKGIRFTHDSAVFCDGMQVIEQNNAVVLIYEAED